MPTVDSAPQQQTWLDTYESADAIFTYSDFGARTLKQQTNNNINILVNIHSNIIFKLSRVTTTYFVYCSRRLFK